MASLRGRTKIYLIGTYRENFDGRKLPTKRHVLQVFFYHHTVLHNTIAMSAKLTIQELEEIWSKAAIPVRAMKNSITRLKKLHQVWQSLQRSKSRKKSETQKKKEDNFKEDLQMLFDITRHDAMEVLTLNQSEFLLSQQTQHRRGLIPGHTLLPEMNQSLNVADNSDDHSEPEGIVRILIVMGLYLLISSEILFNLYAWTSITFQL